ncbi:hypothetical protein CsSME_00044482 [Camellia sinensis var. sinensis]
MAFLLSPPPPPPSLLPKNPNPTRLLRPINPHSLSFYLLPKTTTTARFSVPDPLSGESLTSDTLYNFSVDEWGDISEPESEPQTKLSDADPPQNEDEWGGAAVGAQAGVVDEWGERAEPDAEPLTKLSESDPPKDEDEWGSEEDYVNSGTNDNGSVGEEARVVDDDDDELMELKRCLVDSVYGTDFGFRASAEVRAEVLELINQLEAANPTPVPTAAIDVLDGNWVLVYTAFSELLPLLAAGTTPLLKVERICQAINSNSLTIENSTILSSPFATVSFSASATFEVQTPSRILVEFKEGILQPPEIKRSINLPENIDIFGQKINLSPVQQSLNPLQEAVSSIARSISGQPPLKVPIPGEQSKSWLLISYLDKDLRISRGDGGLFVLAKEGSPLLDQ